MSGGWLEWVLAYGALVCAGSVVKLTDDVLDAEFDRNRGRVTLASRLARAALPYGLVLGLIAARLNLSLTIAVFFGAYAVGMVPTWRERLPTRVPAYVEIGAAMVVSILCVGWRLSIWGLAIMAVIDWLDDVVDASNDKLTGQRNLAVRFGVVETLLSILVALCVAVLVNAADTALVFAAVPVVTAVAELTTTRWWSDFGDDEGVGA